MPDREDDRYFNQANDDGLRYCQKHKQWYRIGHSCGSCYHDSLGSKEASESIKTAIPDWLKRSMK